MTITQVKDERDCAIEFYQRAHSGDEIAERQFDSRLLPAKLRELVVKYEIRMKPDEVVPTDAAMATRVFEAGLDVLADVGMYCVDTGRTIRVSRDEVLRALDQVPEKITQGSGAEAIEIRARELEDKRPAVAYCGFGGATVAEEIWIPALATYAREEIDGLILGALPTVLGAENRALTPVEILACKKEAIWARQVASTVGKPGMAFYGIMSGITSEAQSAGFFPDGLWLHDRMTITGPPNLKLEFQHLNKLLFAKYLGIVTHVSPWTTIGVYGGPESSAVASVAALLAACALGAESLSFGIVDISTGSETGRDSLWTAGMSLLAFTASGHRIGSIGAWCETAAGAGTEMAVHESVGHYVTTTVCGGTCVYGGVGNKGAPTDQLTGMNARLMLRILGAAAGMDLKEANEIVKRANGSYEDRLRAGDLPAGKSFAENYDPESLEPTSASLTFDEDQLKWLRGVGLQV